MRETLTPIAKRCYSDHNDGAHGDPRPTGCEYGFRKRLRCEKCPHWSEARFGASVGELYAEGFAEGLKNTPNKARAHWEKINPLKGGKTMTYKEALEKARARYDHLKKAHGEDDTYVVGFKACLEIVKEAET